MRNLRLVGNCSKSTLWLSFPYLSQPDSRPVQIVSMGVHRWPTGHRICANTIRLAQHHFLISEWPAPTPCERSQRIGTRQISSRTGSQSVRHSRCGGSVPSYIATRQAPTNRLVTSVCQVVLPYCAVTVCYHIVLSWRSAVRDCQTVRHGATHYGVPTEQSGGINPAGLI